MPPRSPIRCRRFIILSPHVPLLLRHACAERFLRDTVRRGARARRRAGAHFVILPRRRAMSTPWRDTRDASALARCRYILAPCRSCAPFLRYEPATRAAPRSPPSFTPTFFRLCHAATRRCHFDLRHTLTSDAIICSSCRFILPLMISPPCTIFHARVLI